MSVIIDARLSSDVSIIEALRKKGYRATSQRIAICRFALDNREYPTARRIYTAVKKLHPTVSLATVYNTLQVLRELHLVQELSFVKGETRFDSNVAPHVNVVCLRCGTVSDVDDRVAREVVARATSKARFTVTGQRFDIYGICDKCARRNSATKTD
ncbi:MAG: Fur family transcriptional regulator [Candidatus Bathyarchaeia archaeon]|jgi:Fur family peroxide stress response transcriptional regulator